MAEDNIPTELTIQFRKPIEYAGQEYPSILITEPTGGDLVKAAKATSSIEQLVNLVHLNAKIPKGAAELILQRDLQVAGNFFGRFSEPPPTTSAPSLSS